MKKWMKPIVLAAMACSMLLAPVGGTVMARSNFISEGYVLGETVAEQMKATINGKSIPGYTFRNAIWVPVKHLPQFGFDVAVNGNSTPIRITRNVSKEVKGVSEKQYNKKKQVQFTQRDVYVGNRKLTSYKIDNTTVIRLSDLSLFGGLTWDGKNKTIALKLGTFDYQNKLNVWLTDDKVYNRTGHELNEVGLKHYFYKNGVLTDEVETLSYVRESAEITGNKYSEDKKLRVGYIGTVLYYVETQDYEKITNPYVEQDIEYCKSNARTGDIEFQTDNEFKVLNNEISKEEKKLKTILKNELIKNKYQPLKVTATQVDYDSIGTPEVSIKVWNLTEKRIIAFETTITGFDGYNRVVRNSLSGESSLKGIAQDFNLDWGGSSVFTWKMYFHDNTMKINAKITSVRYSDGTVWRAK
ncbi:copper amine oxidase domain-containing protein [Paenibacillus alvei TS-15]|uniref:Copper amine oxidase domain-containing protein n=1 Tax=Paenibacillus alvei TS-15 TaxID=1117108 RepID=S9SQF4_PAEAL|nr:hypothetical protein [Paenibacillus alvei]EPY06944.1 copper amine oxidase domain-containing protein [Paenibacillus alvei TS-15]